MIWNFFRKSYSTFVLSSTHKKLYQYFKSSKSNSKDIENKKVVLVECVEELYYYSLFGTIIKSLQDKQSVYVEQYIQRSLTLGASHNVSSLLKSIFFNNRLRDNKWIKLYSAYCNSVAYRYQGNFTIFSDITTFFQAYQVYKKIKSKNDVLKLNINMISVGDLIYDTYLRFKPAATVNVNDFYLCIVIWQTIRNINITTKYFRNNKPSILLTSYSTYIQHGVTVRIALQNNVKVYSLATTQKIGKLLTKDDYYHSANFKYYKQGFDKLENREEALNISKIALENRLSGSIDAATFYMKESAYKISNVEVPNVKNSIIVFLHDFFDSPHIYGNMLFPDFLEWIEFTIEVFEKYNIPYFLKPHPNQVSDSETIIKTLQNKYKNLKTISSKITNRQLVDNGMKVGISVYGTVAHELVYMGVPVILCGENPHSSYNFCFEAESIEAYENNIKNYQDIKVVDNAKQEVESFYYMHNNNTSKDMKRLMNSLFSLRDTNDVESKYENLLVEVNNNIEFQKFINILLKY